MRFHARALDAQQQVVSVTLDAADEADARQQLHARHLAPVGLKMDGGWIGKVLHLQPQGAAAFDILLFAHELHALVAAGLSVIESLDALAERADQTARRQVLQRLCTDLRNGLRLSSALARQPQTFAPLFVGLIQAAEGTSDLPQTLERYIAYESRLQALRHRLSSAAIYPAILLSVGSAVTLFLLGYVVPRFATVYQGSGRALPWASQMLLRWGSLVADNAVALLVALFILGALLVWGLRGVLQNGGWWRVLAWVPGAAPRILVLQLSRLYLTLGMLLEGGIPLERALQLGEAVLSPAKASALDAVRQAIKQGEALSGALERHALSTPVALRLIRVGEQTGQLGVMLTRTAAFYDSETSRWLERFTKTFEPVLMAGIGLVIGLIVILLYMPVFELAGSLQ
jgi:general secretion pathway protein F